MSNENIWELLNNQRAKDPILYGQPFTDINEIESVQKILHVHFSESYLKFIKEYGNAELPGHTIFGMHPLEEHIKTVLDKTLFYREHQKWPDIEDWYIISDDGFGNPIGVDPEGKVWLSDHDCGFEKVLLADSFEEFLYKLYTETLYE